jgi:DNA anti-recombination protein RmuC
MAVDAWGGKVIDPTENVAALVKALELALAEFRAGDIKYVDTQLNAAEKLQNYARNAEAKLQEMAHGSETRLRDSLRDADKLLSDAETRRIDQLAQTRQEFQNTIRDMLAESVRTTSTLVSTQLVQIQATFDTRVSKLEAGAFTQAGKSSVLDPAVADAMARIPASIAALANSTAETMAKMVSTNAEALAKLAASVAAVGKM